MIEAALTPNAAAMSYVAAAPAPESIRAAIDAAPDVEAIAAAAADIRRMAPARLAQGESALDAVHLITELNDRVTERLLRRAAGELGLDLDRACWIAFGSQGRREQTLVTDQDNGWVIEGVDPVPDRARWLELGQRVNQALDACGYSLCRGRVMAGEPDCCLTVAQWCRRFDQWIDHGRAQDLLNASIYFDARALVGRRDLVSAMRQHFTGRAATLPRFCKQLADNALRNSAALSWLGHVRSLPGRGRPMFDLKLHGTMLFVDAARLYALAQGIDCTGTDARLDAVCGRLHVPAYERETWRRGFEDLLQLRLQMQALRGVAAGDCAYAIALDELDATQLDRLKRSLKAARQLQQRIALDYQG